MGGKDSIKLLITFPLFSQTVSIPDTNFLNALIEEGVDANEDGLISYTEAESITFLDVSYKDITDVTGIETFTNIDSFICINNPVTTLDVSKNTSLKLLDCGGNLITSLDVSKNTALTVLHCSCNQLTSLDVSNNTSLSKLSCYSNEFTTLDVSQNTALTELSCGYNELVSLDVTKNTALTNLQCYGNKLTSLDVTSNTDLAELNCSQNELISLDLSSNTSLVELGCSQNELISLDLSSNTALRSLSCGAGHWPPWAFAEANPLISLNISQCIELSFLNCNGCKLTSLDVSKNTALLDLIITNMPTLHAVCVWEGFRPDSVIIDTTHSPNLYFTTQCATGITEADQTDLIIYPNPTDGTLTIETDNPEQNTIEIHSLNGQLIYSSKMEGTSQQIDLSSFQKGVYFITVRSRDYVRTEKIIKL